MSEINSHSNPDKGQASVTDQPGVHPHTPGPWRIDPDTRIDMEWNNHIVAPNGNAVCFMANYEDLDISDANAALVAAAPDLLQAAIAVDALIENLWKAVPWGRTFNLDVAALNNAPLALKAAIAKAQGIVSAVVLCLVLVACSEITAPPVEPPAYAILPSLANVTYCTGAGLPLKMDVYSPGSVLNRKPVVVFFHGGGWMAGDKTSDVGMYDFPNFTMFGYTVVSANYRVGFGSYPANLEDAKCVIRHLRANRDVYGIRTERIGVWGHSAGGQLAALLAVSDSGVHEGVGGWADQSSRVQAVGIYAGAFDLTRLEDFRDTSQGDVVNAFGDSAFVASPINHITTDDPPFLIFHGDRDPSIAFVQAQLMTAQLQAVGVPVTFVRVVNGGHYMLISSKDKKAGLVQTPSRLAIRLQLRKMFDTRVK